MAQKFIFFDMEMTGLNPETDRILEVGAVLWDGQQPLGGLLPHVEQAKRFTETNSVIAWTQAERVYWCVGSQPREILDAMNPWCKAQHGKSGLVDASAKSMYHINTVEDQLLEWLSDCGVAKGEGVLVGNTIHFDRMFIRRWMPDLDAYLNYRLLDVSAIRQFFLLTQPSTEVGVFAAKKNDPAQDDDDHRVLGDIIACIEELSFYTNTVTI